ncbi:MAG: acyltransferase [Akkermansiaceae bacterium]|nr:acyltransferase [Akkermansiaceae bacterium]
MNNNRIEWIDSIRGIAILLVVMGHLSYTQYNENLKFAIYSFHMPMFFLLAGCTAELSIRRASSLLGFIKNKFWVLFIPYAVWNFLPLPFACIDDFVNYSFWKRFEIFISGRCNNGGLFWFLYTLFVFQCLFALYTWVEKKTSGALIRFGFVIMTFAILYTAKHLWSDDGSGFGLACQTYLFYLPFVSGICMIKYKKFKSFLMNKWTISIFILLTLYLLNIRYHIPHVSTLTRIAGIGVTVILIMLIEKGQIPHFDAWKKYLCAIGRHSMAIYIIHYTFVSTISIQFSDTLTQAAPSILFCVYLPLSVVISVFCIMVSKIIETSPVLASVMLGKVKKSADKK